MAATRKSMSKKTRFEVFKRDGFQCQYCGAHPPAAILHVDHIVAVVAGGTNVIDNLVTACATCNLGKGAGDLTAIPQSLAEKAASVSEREAQILGYQAVMQAKADRIEDELWRVAEEIEPGSSERGMRRDWTSSIRRFNERLGVHVVLGAAAIARGRFPYGGAKTFRYFCGVCWNAIREEDGNA